MNTDPPIPERLNWLILALALPAGWGLLWSASHLGWGWALLAAWAYAFVHHTPFSLLHEAVHGVFSPHPGRNALAGHLTAAAFPTAFSLQRVSHLGHHQRNRSDAELYDYYLPGQSRALRNFQLYAGNLLGLYWFCIPLSNLIYLLAPGLFVRPAFIRGPARWLGFEHFVADIARQPKVRIWFECLLAFTWQAAVWWALVLTWQGWLLCHAAFALHWSALQYVDHAWSPRHPIEGAWNLKVSRPARWLALNYHDHLAHHRQPRLPWCYLPQAVKPDDPRPGFWPIYFSLWGGVRPAPPMAETAGQGV